MAHPRRPVQQCSICGSEGECSHFSNHPPVHCVTTQTQVPRVQTKVGLTNFRSQRRVVPATAPGSAAAQPAAPATPAAAEATAADAAQQGWQRVSLKFHAPAAGVYQLQVICMSDYWVGCDARVSLKLKVLKAKKESLAEVKQLPETAGREGSADEGEAGEGELTESGTSESGEDD